MTVRLAHIDVFPFKSFDPVSVDQVRVLPSGSLEQDRRFALFDDAGKVINGKRTPLVHSLRFTFDDAIETVTITERQRGADETYSLQTDQIAIESRLSDVFGVAVTLRENSAGGFPDDTIASGPTIIAAETLSTIADWFGISFDEARRRFRANLIIEGGGPFWDDHLFAAPGESVTFRLGELIFFGMNPCARCVVPSRDPDSAEAISGFQKVFSTRRRDSLPPWADTDAFDHFYRAAVNTRLFAPADGGVLKVGDSLEIAD